MRVSQAILRPMDEAQQQEQDVWQVVANFLGVVLGTPSLQR
jgi:hypothetical protein